MSDTTRMAAVAALIGDPARANILNALMDGRALTAKELAFAFEDILNDIAEVRIAR